MAFFHVRANRFVNTDLIESITLTRQQQEVRLLGEIPMAGNVAIIGAHLLFSSGQTETLDEEAARRLSELLDLR